MHLSNAFHAHPVQQQLSESVKWPVGTGAKGNEGVAAQLSQIDGALGYVEAAFVKPPLQAAALTNAAGRVVKPTAQSEQEALAAIDLGPDLIGGNPNPQAGYPIVTFSWILLYKSGESQLLQREQPWRNSTVSGVSLSMDQP
jgi:phosphate transport system substrate-binding protein